MLRELDRQILEYIRKKKAYVPTSEISRKFDLKNTRTLARLNFLHRSGLIEKSHSYDLPPQFKEIKYHRVTGKTYYAEKKLIGFFWRKKNE